MKRLLLAVVILILAAAAGFSIWAGSPADPMPEALAAMQGSPAVLVQEKDWMEFIPTGASPTLGLVLYPGGRVDPRAYAPLAVSIAEVGYFVAIPPMPLNMALFDADRASEVIAAHPEIDRWVIGGHSLGGVAAAGYAQRNPGSVDGLILYAAYPAASASLATSPLPVLSVYGTEDIDVKAIEDHQHLLPPDTQWVVLEGGNHAQFGWYGPQQGDGIATISRETQQEQVLTATMSFLQTIP